MKPLNTHAKFAKSQCIGVDTMQALVDRCRQVMAVTIRGEVSNAALERLASGLGGQLLRLDLCNSSVEDEGIKALAMVRGITSPTPTIPWLCCMPGLLPLRLLAQLACYNHPHRCKRINSSQWHLSGLSPLIRNAFTTLSAGRAAGR